MNDMIIDYKSKKYYIGAKFKNNKGFYFVILGKSRDKKDYFYIEFIKNKYICEVGRSNLLKDEVKNPYDPIIPNVGFLGVGDFKPKDNKKLYNIWAKMIKRCYDEEVQRSQPTYVKCLVSKKWHNYQNYAEWYEKNYIKGYHVDKDLLQIGIEYKIYSENTCLFLDRNINTYIKSLCLNNDSSSGYKCITVKNSKYVVVISCFLEGKTNYVGTFLKKEDAVKKLISEKNKQVEIVKKYMKDNRYKNEVINLIEIERE